MSKFVLREQQALKYGTLPEWEQQGLVTAFTCKQGGSSKLLPHTLNMALHVGDEPELVLANRRKVAQVLGYDWQRATTCAQVHGSSIALVTPELVGSGATTLATTIAGVDSLVTQLREVPLMLFFADCVPVLLADPQTHTIAVAHAGWRGSVAGIVSKTIRFMQEHCQVEPKHLLAAIGPSIGGCCFEVDEKVKQQAQEASACFVANRPGHYLFDLWQLNRSQLLEQGVLESNITCAQVCTYEQHQDFFSYRAEAGKTGRMAALLMQK